MKLLVMLCFLILTLPPRPKYLCLQVFCLYIVGYVTKDECSHFGLAHTSALNVTLPETENLLPFLKSDLYFQQHALVDVCTAKIEWKH